MQTTESEAPEAGLGQVRKGRQRPEGQAGVQVAKLCSGHEDAVSAEKVSLWNPAARTEVKAL